MRSSISTLWKLPLIAVKKLWTRRLRGAVLRLAFRRQSAFFVGAVCFGAAVWFAVGDYGWESRLSDGLVMIVGATGVALLLMGLSGRQSDWDE